MQDIKDLLDGGFQTVSWNEDGLIEILLEASLSRRDALEAVCEGSWIIKDFVKQFFWTIVDQYFQINSRRLSDRTTKPRPVRGVKFRREFKDIFRY